MLSYTSEDEIRKYFDADETLSPEQIDAVRTAWNTTITIINAVNPQDTTEARLDALYVAQRISDKIVDYIDDTTSPETIYNTIYDRKRYLTQARIAYENAQMDLVAACIAQAALDGADPMETQVENKEFIARLFQPQN